MDIEGMSKEELINYVKNLNESNNGKYGLVWDKEKEPEKIVEECNQYIPVLTENENRKIENNGENNILIEGDNFHALSVLNYTHHESIDVIYIDPPYNTGNEDFVYNDNYIDNEDGYRHSKWLNFMEKRLLIARNLLNKHGIIMISIDDNEYSQLKLLCDKIFYAKNLLSTHHIQVRYNNKSLNEDNDFQPIMEYVLIYAKNKPDFKANKPVETYDLSKFCYKITELTSGEKINIGNKNVIVFKEGEWKIEKEKGRIGLLKETWASGSIVRQSGTAAQFLSKYLIQRKEIDGLNTLYKIDNMGEDGLGYRYVTGPKKADAIRGKFYSGVPLERIEEIKENGNLNKTRPIPNYYDYSADFGNIRQEGGIAFNSGKKPIKMLKELINYHPSKNAVVLDFFAGSGSTGHAVMELNKDDNGSRKFILCTNNEVPDKLQKAYMKDNNLTEEEFNTIKEQNDKKWMDYSEKNGICTTVTYPRMKNVIQGYDSKSGLEGTLRYYKTDFVANNVTRDQIYYDLTEKCIPMLCVKEETYEKIERNDQYAIYTNKEKNKYTCVYFDTIGNRYNEFIEKVKEIKQKKILYIFTLGNRIEEPRLEEIKNYQVEAIPQRIYNLYKKLAKKSKEM